MKHIVKTIVVISEKETEKDDSVIEVNNEIVINQQAFQLPTKTHNNNFFLKAITLILTTMISWVDVRFGIAILLMKLVFIFLDSLFRNKTNSSEEYQNQGQNINTEKMTAPKITAKGRVPTQAQTRD